MSSTDVEFGVDYSIEVPEIIVEQPPDSAGEKSCSDTKMEVADQTDSKKNVQDDSLFKLCGVDFVAEGKYIFGRPEENKWELKNLEFSDSKLNESRNLVEKIEERCVVEHETGDGLQQSPRQDNKSPVNVETEMTKENEPETDKPIVRKQFKNFKLNERILDQISSERAGFSKNESRIEPETTQPQGLSTNQIVFNAAGSGRVYTLTFNREENSEILKEDIDAAFNECQFKNSYALNETKKNRSIYDDVDTEMPLRRIPDKFWNSVPDKEFQTSKKNKPPIPADSHSVPEDILLKKIRTLPPDDEFRTRSSSEIPEKVPALKVYKTHSDLTVESPKVLELNKIPNACETLDTSRSTDELDEKVEDEITTVEPLSSTCLVTSLGDIKAQHTAVIVLGCEAGCSKREDFGDESMPSDVSLEVHPSTNAQLLSTSERSLSTKFFDEQTVQNKTKDNFCDYSLEATLETNEVSKINKITTVWRSRLRSGGSTKASTSMHQQQSSMTEELDSMGDEESISVNVTRKNSFISIDLKTSETEAPHEVNINDVTDWTGRLRPRKNQESKKNSKSRIFKMKRKIKNICEKVKHNVIRRR